MSDGSKRQKLNSTWFRQNWVLVFLAIFSAISTFFGGVTGFADLVQQALNLHPTLFQSISFVLFVGGSIGLVTVATLLVRKPGQSPEFVQCSRVDSFTARIDKEEYELEQEIFFMTTFAGKLRAGYFESVLVAPDNKVHRVSDPQTLHFPKHRQRGLLQGEIQNASSRWSTRAPIDCPLGEFTAHIGVYDSPALDWFTETRLRGLLYWGIRKFLHKSIGILAPPPKPCLDQRTMRFHVVKRLEDDQA